MIIRRVSAAVIFTDERHVTSHGDVLIGSILTSMSTVLINANFVNEVSIGYAVTSSFQSDFSWVYSKY